MRFDVLYIQNWRKEANFLIQKFSESNKRNSLDSRHRSQNSPGKSELGSSDSFGKTEFGPSKTGCETKLRTGNSTSKSHNSLLGGDHTPGHAGDGREKLGLDAARRLDQVVLLLAEVGEADGGLTRCSNIHFQH